MKRRRSRELRIICEILEKKMSSGEVDEDQTAVIVDSIKDLDAAIKTDNRQRILKAVDRIAKAFLKPIAG